MGLQVIFVFDGDSDYDSYTVSASAIEDKDPNSLTKRKIFNLKKRSNQINGVYKFDSDLAKWGNLESFSKQGQKFPATNLPSPPLITR